MPSAIAIHDLSLWSKSSLSVVLPVLEAMGIEVFSLPTSILSTQSDGFEDLKIIDMENSILDYYEKVKSYGYSFDAIYSGYLGNSETAHSVEKIIVRENALALIDPVLGDNGELYQSLEESNVRTLRKLIGKADIITPNITEACLLTGRGHESAYSNRKISGIIRDLRVLGPEKGVITSVPLEIGRMANVAYVDEEIRIFSYEDLSVSYPGSGDLFASLLLSLILDDNSFFPSVKVSGEITTRAVEYAKVTKRERRMGISLIPVMNDIRKIL